MINYVLNFKRNILYFPRKIQVPLLSPEIQGHICRMFSVEIQSIFFLFVPTRTAVIFVTFLLGIPMVMNGGIYLLNLVDYSVSGFPLLFVGILEAVAISWIYGEYSGFLLLASFCVWCEWHRFRSSYGMLQGRIEHYGVKLAPAKFC